MLLAYEHNVDSRVIDPFTTTHEGYQALISGKMAVLALAGYSPAPALSEATIAETLLDNPSTAIMHFEDPAPEEEADSVMMAVNYHMGHSEGYHKIVVQDPAYPNAGPWMLWVPPGSGNRTFYRRSSRYSSKPYLFEKSPTNPDKIRHYLMHAGEPDEAITSFKEMGFVFTDEILPVGSEEFNRLRDLSLANEQTWDPLQT